MKTPFLLIKISCLFFILFSGCLKDQYDLEIQDSELYKENARLEQILLYSKIDSEQPIGIVEEYEYDEKGRITRTSSPMYDNGLIVGTIKYNLHEYNASDQLVKISNFNANINSPTGYINLQNYIYSYSADGKKIKESIENLDGIISEFTDYEYENDLLVIVRKYSHNTLESYTENQYDSSGRLIRETRYTADNKCLSYTIHSYSGYLQVRSDLYYNNGTHYRSIKRTFDNNNNLIILESNELALYSSMMSHVLRYKYFD